MSLLRAVSLASMALAASDKRGLVFVPDEDFPDDNKIWVRDGSAISWYYNYESLPSPAFSDLSQDEFEFVPMMWGANSDNPEEDIWLNQVTDLMDSGTNITHVLGFNEPDAPFSWGGSDLTPEVAARAWVANFEPLAERGVKLGLPGCTGGWDSLPWLRQFLGNCSDIISTDDEKKNCTWDFVPVHWYDNFAGLASHIGERRAEYVPITSVLREGIGLTLISTDGPVPRFGSPNTPTRTRISNPRKSTSSRPSTTSTRRTLSAVTHISVPSAPTCPTWDPTPCF